MTHVSRLSAVVVAITALMLVNCSDDKPGSDGCKSKDDCAADQACVGGECVAAIATCGLCTDTGECSGTQVCAAIDAARKACVPACDITAPDCATDFHCADGGCVPDAGVCCVDADGDGLGSGVDCSSVDCDDANINCGADCTDADGDTWCVGNDCADTKAHCAADCTDVDADDWCVDQDCNDNDGAATDVCVYCETDADGDGYGPGCPAGDDCNDLNPNCNADCTDADADNWCLGVDCNDNNAHCDEDCTDGDADGWCGIHDCDDANAHCDDPENCVDVDRDGWCINHDCDDGLAHCDADCTDIDGDLYCGTHDCDDTLATGLHCAETCADADGDQWCDDQDCDDVLPSRNEDCSGCAVDADGDGYGGPGDNGACDLGPDCDDSLPFCNVACTDVDGDEYCVGYDCDDNAIAVNPSATEICNGIDDNCDPGFLVDFQELPHAQLCPNPNATVLQSECESSFLKACKTATCTGDQHDLNGVFADGCECKSEPGDTVALTCSNAKDLGDLIDSAPVTLQVDGTLPIADRTAWYHFKAIDDDTGENVGTPTDAFNVTVGLTDTMGTGEFVFLVARKQCTDPTPGVDDQIGPLEVNGAPGTYLATSFDWNLVNLGVCNPESCDPCPDYLCPDPIDAGASCDSITGCPGNTGNQTCGSGIRCATHTADFYVGVRRKAGFPVSCNGFRLEIRNGPPG